MISDLLAFLNARLDEIERLANQAQPWPYGSDPATAWIGIPGPNPLYVWAHMTAHDPAHVLREVAAKRALIAFALENAARVDGEWGDCHEAAEIARGQCGDYGEDAAYEVLGPLAAIDGDHVDYRQEWAPEGSSDAR